MRSPEPRFDLRLHRFEQIEILQLLAECLGALEFELVLLQEFEHVLHVGRRLAIVAEQSLAAAALIESRKASSMQSVNVLPSSRLEKTKG